MADSAEKEIRDAVDQMSEALHAGDAAQLDSLLSDRSGTICIGTDPGEWWTKQQLVASIKEAMSVGDSQIRAEHDEVHVHVEGDVAWTDGTGRFVNENGTQRATRMTGVFVREGGRWKATQLHASIGVPNEEMF
jgi:ketosteroid isomerase-like protein